MLGETADAVADYGSQKAAAAVAAACSESAASTNGAAAAGDSMTTLRRESEGRSCMRVRSLTHKPFYYLRQGERCYSD